MDCSAYVRVSSKAQGYEMQVHALTLAAQARGDVVGQEYREKLSGKTLDRPELARLRQDAREGRIKRLYVYRLDRLARSGIRDTLEVVEELRRHGVELVSVADGFDLNGPAAEVVLAVMAWAAKMERLAINERIAGARARLESEGRSWGRPRRANAATEARMVELRGAGRSLRDIAVAVKVPLSTVARVCRKVPRKNAA